MKNRSCSQRKHRGLLKNSAGEDLHISCSKKKTISMLPRWEFSTNICILMISGVRVEKTLK